MRGFTLEGTEFDQPIETCVRGIGLVNFTIEDEMEINKSGDKVQKHVLKIQPVIDEVEALEDKGEKVPSELESRLTQGNREFKDLLYEHTFTVTKRALCLHPSGDSLPWQTIDQFKRDVGEPVRRRLELAYKDGMERLGKPA